MPPSVYIALARAWFLRIFVLISLLFPVQGSGTTVAVQSAAPTASAITTELISNSQFVYGPAARQFDLASYLTRIGSPLLPQAGLIDSWCGYASVSPRVLLVLLELDGEQVTLGWKGPSSAEQQDALLNDLAIGLAERFYRHLYEYGERAPVMGRSGVAPVVHLADAVALSVSPSVSSATFAVLDTLAPGRTSDQLAELVDPVDPNGFAATWARLFPQSDPLDATVSITPHALPPDDLFQFPFPVGQTWWFNGAHNWNGSGATYGKPYSSMDFFTQASSCSVPPASDWAVAAAAGAGYHPSGYSCWYRIDHTGGWTTSYYHLRNAIPNGQVTIDGQVGTIACETCAGGFASSPHVHLSLLYNGAYVDLEGVKLAGWMVHSGSGNYTTGSLERNGVQLKPYASVLNEGVKTSATSTPTPTLTPSQTPTVAPSQTSTVTFSQTLTATPSQTPTATPAQTFTATPSQTLTVAPVETRTATPSQAPSPTPSQTSTVTPSQTLTATPSRTPTLTPSQEPTTSTVTVATYSFPKSKDLIRACPVTLVAGASAPPGAQVRFMMRQGSTAIEVGRDSDGADGWQTQWDCQDVPDGSLVLSLSVFDANGIELLHEASQTAVTLSKQCGAGTYRTAFFANTTLAGSPTSSWCKASGINYNWGAASPGAGVPGADNFSARFRGNLAFEGGTYRFTLQVDDGARIWLDRALVLDEWQDHSMATGLFEFTQVVPAGLHEVWLDYYEQTGAAGVILSWSRIYGGATGETNRIYLPPILQ